MEGIGVYQWRSAVSGVTKLGKAEFLCILV